MSVASDLIIQIENAFRELSKEYTLFFNDVSKIEPYEMKEALNALIKTLRNLVITNTEDKFKANNLIARVQSHFALWERQLEKKYSGEPRKRKATAKPKPKPKQKEPDKKYITIQDPSTQRDSVVALYDEYTRLNLLLGVRKMVNFTNFQNFIQTQTQKVQTAKNAKKVRYEVLVHDQKVVIKTKSLQE